MKWFRFYSEFRHDTKMRRMPIAHRYAFIVLLCLANDSSTRGVISGLDDEDLAFELEMEIEDWRTLKAKFRVKGLIDIGSDGAISITNWDKRQFASDSSAERVAKHRAGKKKGECNVTSLLLKRHVTPSDTDTDTDPDPDPESTCNSLVGVLDTEIADAIASEKPAHGFGELEIESSRPELAKNSTDSPLAKKGRSHSAKPTARGKGSAAARLENLKSSEVYELVSNRQSFEDFWGWYCKHCTARSANAGSKKQAAIAWINTLESGDFEQNIEQFRAGCRAFNWNAVGIPHAAIFIRGSRTDGRQPYWESALEQQAAIASTDSPESSVLSLPTTAAPTDLAESLMVADTSTHPWCGDRAHLLGFVEYLSNTGDRRKAEQERRQIAVGVIRKGNAAMVGSIEHQRVLQSWFLFLENAAKSQTVQQATGADKMPAHLREFFANRDKARADDF